MKAGCGTETNEAKRSIELPVLATGSFDANLIRQSRTSRWRAGVLITLNLLMLAHILQWWIMGSTISPIEPSESMFTLQRGAVNAGLIFFVLAIAATLIFGRFVCGWGCHIVALQDLCTWLLKKMRLTPRPFRSRLLVFVPLIVALYMFVWPTVQRYFFKPAAEPLFPQFTNHLVTTDFWATFPPIAVAIPFLFVCGFLAVYFLGNKGFCTYGCPYGGFFGVADQIAPGKIRVTDACNQCGHCTAACTSNVLVHSEVKQFGMVVDPGCLKCMDCVSVCPNDALYFGFGKPSLAVPRPEKTHHQLTWPEEFFAAAVFFLSFLAVWDVYQLVPMLMALGIAGVTTVVAVRLLKLVRFKDNSFYRFNLKAGGKMRAAGWLFAAASVAWLGLIAHSGWVHYNERQGSIAFQRLQIPDELALAKGDPAQWLTASDQALIADGKYHFLTARRTGIFVNAEALSRLAWFEFLSGDGEKAVEMLDQAARWQHGQGSSISRYYRGAILDRLGRHEEAIQSLDAAITARPDLVLAYEEKGTALWKLGRRQEAVAAWSDAVRRNEDLVLSNNFLSGASAMLGRTDGAAAFKKQADERTPADARFHWMLGLRLQDLGMTDLAKEHFEKAAILDQSFRPRLGDVLKGG